MPRGLERGVIEAAGGLVWRDGPAGPELAVIFRPRLRDWALPKGHLKKGETYQQAALREVREETGSDAVIDTYAGCTTYLVHGIPKIVLFWNMRTVGDQPFEPNKEVDEVAWLAISVAVQKLVYPNERILVLEAVQARWPGLSVDQ